MRYLIFFAAILFFYYNANGQLYLNQIKTRTEWKKLANLPLNNKYNGVESIKIIYDIRRKKVYYINGNNYKYHSQFAYDVLGYNGIQNFNRYEYSESRARSYIIANVNFFIATSIVTIDFFNNDMLPMKQLDAFYKAVNTTLFYGEKIKLLPNNLIDKDKLSPYLQEKLITATEIYSNQQYQLLQKGTAYGLLKIVRDIEKDSVGINDIIIIDNLPMALPRVSAVITSVFQTPLCHVNVLCKTRKIPNAAYKNILKDSATSIYANKWVRVDFNYDKLVVTEVQKVTVLNFNAAINKKKSILPSLNLEIESLVNLKNANIKFAGSIGGKAANFAELYKIKVGKQKLPVPENAFAIPMYFYFDFVTKNKLNGLLNEIDTVTNDNLIVAKLKVLRKKITDGKIDSTFLNIVKAKITSINKNDNYRFRSSTNAEDISGFSGAGLYDSKSGSLIDSTKSIEKAIKKVWASLWNERAFFERRNFGMNDKNVGMAILVHKAFGTEEVNGVAITKNLYRNNYPAYTINVQDKEVSIVQPNDSITCEQTLLHIINLIYDGREEYTAETITFSSLSPQKSLLTKEEYTFLGQCLSAIEQHFYKIYLQKNTSNYSGDNMEPFRESTEMDVEFKLNAGNRKLYIKQARPY